jgi:hypothetical protein
MEKYSEAKQCFLEEVRDKKKTASGVHHKTGKRGYVGKMLFAHDLMSRKEKYNHRKAGKILTSNLYEKIIPLDEFKELETFEQRNRLAYWRTQFSNKEIQKEMGANNTQYYKMVSDLGLPAAPRGGNKSGQRKATAKAIAINNVADRDLFNQTVPAQTTQASTATQVITAPAPVQELIIDGLHLVYNGTFTPEQIVKQLLKFGSLLEDETDKFHIELRLMQKPEPEKES